MAVDGAPPTFSFADLWELVVPAVATRTAIVDGSHRRTFAEVDDRASRLARWMQERGVGPGSFVGVQMRNSVEFLEASLAAHKLRAAAVNINYRFAPAELAYLYDDGPVVGVIHDTDLAGQVDQAVRATRAAPWTLARGEPYDTVIADTPPATPVLRSNDDPYVLYTGGTTGMPKGVVWRCEDAFFTCVGGGDVRGELGPVSRPDELLDRLEPGGAFLPAAPLIHAAGFWTSLRWLLAGVTVVLQPAFDADRIWTVIEEEGVATMNVVGDAMGVPLVEALEAGQRRDLTSLRTIASGGARLSEGTRRRLLRVLPHVTIKDSYGSSETGVQGYSVHTADATIAGPATEAFVVRDTVVLHPETLDEVALASPTPGIVARRGRVPLRYHGDPEKTATTFPTIGGQRHALTGDLGLRLADGRVRILGRGSQCVNSGGEKIYPEEVEAALRTHPDVRDAVVVGVPDPRWGQRVTAVVEPREERELTAGVLRDHCRSELAAFKVPKDIVFVSRVQRTPAGKSDYRWARATVESALEPSSQSAS